MLGISANALKMQMLATHFRSGIPLERVIYAHPSRQKLPVPGHFCRMDRAIWDVEGSDDRIEEGAAFGPGPLRTVGRHAR